ncbi:MAG: PDGLE domain-containing protein [Acidimicrobiales bacterium]
MRPRLRLAVFVAAGLSVALALAFVVAPRASDSPDGLERVAIDQGFDDPQDHALARSPTAGYTVRGVEDDRLSTGLAGLFGVVVTFLAMGALTVLARRAARSRSFPDELR